MKRQEASPMIAETSSSRRFVANIATTERDILDSLQLRCRVFAGELGARIDTAAAGIDADPFDTHCRHLIVRDTLDGRMVASTRILNEQGARRAGRFYSELEFELSFLDGLVGRKLEVGRTCVDPDFRNGVVIATLWAKLAECFVYEGYQYLFGCASIGLEDGGTHARTVMNYLARNHMSPASQRVASRKPLPGSAGNGDPNATPRVPTLLKAYMSLGAKVCGDGYWDEDFNCLDVFVLLNVAQMTPRYARRFVRPAEEALTAA